MFLCGMKGMIDKGYGQEIFLRPLPDLPDGTPVIKIQSEQLHLYKVLCLPLSIREYGRAKRMPFISHQICQMLQFHFLLFLCYLLTDGRHLFLPWLFPVSRSIQAHFNLQTSIPFPKPY